MSSLFDRAGFSWPTRETAGQYELGTPFTVTFAGEITYLRWYRQTASGDAPSAIRVWRASDQTVVATAASIPDGGTVGWKDCPITGGWRPDLNVEYRIGASNPASSGLGQETSGATLSAPAGLAFPQAGRAYHSATPYVYPNSIEPGVWDALDLIYVPDSPPPPPATTGDVDQALIDWLSSSAGLNAHQSDGLPWLTKALLDAWNSGLGAGAVGYFQFMKDAIAAVRERTDRLPDSIEALTNAILTNASDNVDLVLAGLETIQDGVDALTGGSGGTAGGALGALSGRSAFPATGWSMADETDWDTDLAWPVAADLYVFTVTTPPPGAAADSFAGVTWYHRLGSWTTLDGDQAGAREFLEFSPQQLQDGGRRMPGLALRTKNGTLGHVQAWLLA